MARPYQSNIDLLMIAYGVKRAHDALNNTNNDTLQASIILENDSIVVTNQHQPEDDFEFLSVTDSN